MTFLFLFSVLFSIFSFFFFCFSPTFSMHPRSPHIVFTVSTFSFPLEKFLHSFIQLSKLQPPPTDQWHNNVILRLSLNKVNSTFPLCASSISLSLLRKWWAAKKKKLRDAKSRGSFHVESFQPPSTTCRKCSRKKWTGIREKKIRN